jgi:glutaredoxin
MASRALPRSAFLRLFTPVAITATLALTLAAGGHAASPPAEPLGQEISSSQSSVTIYGATWCSACKSLESKLNDRRVPFDVIDVDRNREAYDRARSASGMGSGIPLTNVMKGSSQWFQGDNADAIERAYKGE